MYLHIGGEMMVPLDKIVLIIDLECGCFEEATKEFLDLALAEKKAFFVGKKERSRSVIITDDHVLYTPISVDTLTKRTHNCYI
ncbi:MAG: DUF370 domain-containing protein [Thermacetogeniaceae bacterium]|jgi:regulator of extracellular matrix RemA (YlzA/DUF370 family)|nr:DUF370 domain-containing protein [Syntrophomonadaceae bacterium]